MGRRVVLADAHALMREGLKGMLRDVPGVQVVGEVADGVAAQELCSRLRPDLLLTDCSLPGVDGVLLARLLKARKTIGQVGVLCGCGGKCLEQAVAAGVDGFLLKQADAEEMRCAVRSMLEGGFFVSPGVARRLAQLCREGWRIEQPRAIGWESLTAREREVLCLVAEGYRNREIADLLVVSEKTVEKHRANFMGKLGLHSATDVRDFAFQVGMPLRKHR